MTPENVTLRHLHARCDEDAGCLLWRLKLSRSGAPVWSFTTEDGKHSSVQVRRLVWKLAGKRALEPGEVVTMDCRHPACLEPSHMVAVTSAEVLYRISNELPNKRRRYAAVTQALRAKQGKITMEQARYVRASDKPLSTLAAELGVSAQLLSMVRRGERWPEIAGNHFAGLGARA